MDSKGCAGRRVRLKFESERVRETWGTLCQLCGVIGVTRGGRHEEVEAFACSMILCSLYDRYTEDVTADRGTSP